MNACATYATQAKTLHCISFTRCRQKVERNCLPIAFADVGAGWVPVSRNRAPLTGALFAFREGMRENVFAAWTLKLVIPWSPESNCPHRCVTLPAITAGCKVR
jgi:hypothetical protein